MIVKTPAVWTYPSGREVCPKTILGRREYQSRIALMWTRQKGLCCLCQRPVALCQAVFEHQDGRGHGGGNRDDRIERDGKPYNGAACFRCNAEKGSKRVDYN
jgi:hypothetical protein